MIGSMKLGQSRHICTFGFRAKLPQIRPWKTDVRESGRPRNEPNARRRRDAEGNDWLFDACNCSNNSDSETCFDGLSDNQLDYYSDAILNKMLCELDDECKYRVEF